MSDPRYPASSSNSIARRTSSFQRPDEASDVTWLDFLRTAGGTVPESSDTADRKRRRAGTSPERRAYPYAGPNMSSGTAYRRSSGIQDTQRPAGSSLQNVIDLVTPPRERSTVESGDDTRRSSAGGGLARQGSDVTLPTGSPIHKSVSAPYATRTLASGTVSITAGSVGGWSAPLALHIVSRYRGSTLCSLPTRLSRSSCLAS